MIIDFKYPFVKTWMFLKLLLPFFIFLIVYILSNNYFEQKYINNKDDDTHKTMNLVFNILVLLFATYFMGIEVFQMWT